MEEGEGCRKEWGGEGWKKGEDRKGGEGTECRRE